MRFIFYLVMVFAFCSCEWNHPYQPSQKEKITNEIMKKAAIKIREETGLIPCGTGGQMMHQIKMLYLGFNYHQSIDVNRARELLVKAVQDFASEINGDERIRSYLDKFPFEPKSIHIDLFVLDRKGKDFGEGKLCVATANNGVLTYRAHDSNKSYIILYQETYEEALQIVQDSLAKEQAM